MKRSFLSLYFTNFFGVVNDNYLKTLASFVILSWLGDEKLHSVFMGATAGALVLPYILCSPLADRLTVVFSKVKIFRLAKLVELPIVALAIVGFITHSIPCVVGAILLMGLQSSLYSPAKYALVRDIGGEERISTGMGGMEGIAFLAVLGGTILAGVMADRFGGALQSTTLLVVFALLGLIGSHVLRANEEPNKVIRAINPLRYMARAHRMAKMRYPGLNAVILTLSVFWFGAAMLQQGLIVYGKQVLHLSSSATGLVLCTAAIGIVVGQILAGFVDKKIFLLGYTVLTGLLAAVVLGVLFLVPLNATAFAALIGLLAFDLGFFKLPLDAEIQKVVKGPKLNTMLAYFNQVSFLFMFFASVAYIGVSAAFGPRAFLALLAIVFALAPIYFALSYTKVLLFVGRWIFHRRYNVAVKGMEDIHHSSFITYHSSLLVLPNHPAMVDPMLVGAEFWRYPLKPLADELFFKTGFVAPKVLKTLGAVAVPDLRKNRSTKGATIARGLGDIVTNTLLEGGNVIFYPSGHIQTEGDVEDIGTRQLAYNICRELPPNVEVVLVRTRGLWGSIWSRKGRDASPAFVPTFIKSVLLWFFVSPFIPRRKVTMEVKNMTSEVKEWASTLTRVEFNQRLNLWYNEGK